MNSKEKNIAIIIIIIILTIITISGLIFLILNDSESNPNKEIINNDSNPNSSYAPGPTNEFKINTSGVANKLLGSNELGTVEVLGPFGNTSSNVKIAYLTGMHPLESSSHKSLFDTIKSKNTNLKYEYYIYKINVSKNPTDSSEGRMNGQLLAQEFVAPNVIKENYSLVIDVHGNEGTRSGTYKETNFIFAPGNDSKSKKIVNELLPELNGITHYIPEQQSSPPYITLPIERNGTATINYETYDYEPLNTTYKLMNQFCEKIDNLSF